MNVKYVNLSYKNLSYKKQVLDKIEEVLDSGMFILGPELEAFEKKVANYLGVKYVVGLNSGTDALFLSLKALGVGPGDEVITVSNSFVATAVAIANTGAKPIFVDVKNNYLINEDLIEDAITSKTKVIIPVHLTGKPCNMNKIMSVANKYNLRVLEDCAQSIGAKFEGRKVGSYDVGAFSLHPLKNLAAAGDGGFVATNDEAIYKSLLIYRNIGLKDRNHCEILGFNSRLDNLQAAILNIKIDYLDEINIKRRENAKIYCKELQNVHEIKYIPFDLDNEYSVYHTFVIQVERRDELKDYLKNYGVETNIHYPNPIHVQKAFNYLNIDSTKLEFTDKQSRMILSLPINESVTSEELKYVSNMIKNFYFGDNYDKK